MLPLIIGGNTQPFSLTWQPGSQVPRTLTALAKAGVHRISAGYLHDTVDISMISHSNGIIHGISMAYYPPGLLVMVETSCEARRLCVRIRPGISKISKGNEGRTPKWAPKPIDLDSPGSFIWVNFITSSRRERTLEIMVGKGNHPLLWPNYSG